MRRLVAVLVVLQSAVGTTLGAGGVCQDVPLTNGTSCSDLPHVCLDVEVAHLFCPVTCHKCDVHEEWQDLLNGSRGQSCEDSAPPFVCDVYRNGEGDCSTATVWRLCGKTCALRHTAVECRDSEMGQTPCAVMPGVCDHAFSAAVLCPAYCGSCDVYELWVTRYAGCFGPPTCEDSVSYDKCIAEGACNSPLAASVCPRTCFNCFPPQSAEAAPASDDTDVSISTLIG